MTDTGCGTDSDLTWTNPLSIDVGTGLLQGIPNLVPGVSTTSCTVQLWARDFDSSGLPRGGEVTLNLTINVVVAPHYDEICDPLLSTETMCVVSDTRQISCGAYVLRHTDPTLRPYALLKVVGPSGHLKVGNSSSTAFRTWSSNGTQWTTRDKDQNDYVGSAHVLPLGGTGGAEWQFDWLPRGRWDILVAYKPDSVNNSATVQYTVRDANLDVFHRTINQRRGPEQDPTLWEVIDGRLWRKLTTITLVSGTIKVSAQTSESIHDGAIIADAVMVRFQKAGDPLIGKSLVIDDFSCAPYDPMGAPTNTDPTLNVSGPAVSFWMNGTVQVTTQGIIEGNFLNLVARSLTVDRDGKISADGMGYADKYSYEGIRGDFGCSYQLDLSRGPGFSGVQGPVGSPWGAAYSHCLAGGGYGGDGGYALDPNSYNLNCHGKAYGDMEYPNFYGSAGSQALTHSTYHPANCSAWLKMMGGAGGGMIKVDVTGSIVVEGTISANGHSGYSRATGPDGIDVPGFYQFSTGGGSGGTIFLKAQRVAGSGDIRASGGAVDFDFGFRTGGGGGGGRIAIFGYDLTDLSTMNFAEAGSVVDPNVAPPGTGTIFIHTVP